MARMGQVSILKSSVWLDDGSNPQGSDSLISQKRDTGAAHSPIPSGHVCGEARACVCMCMHVCARVCVHVCEHSPSLKAAPEAFLKKTRIFSLRMLTAIKARVFGRCICVGRIQKEAGRMTSPLPTTAPLSPPYAPLPPLPPPPCPAARHPLSPVCAHFLCVAAPTWLQGLLMYTADQAANTCSRSCFSLLKTSCYLCRVLCDWQL